MHSQRTYWTGLPGSALLRIVEVAWWSRMGLAVATCRKASIDGSPVGGVQAGRSQVDRTVRVRHVVKVGMGHADMDSTGQRKKAVAEKMVEVC